jgi:hypothetical protein
MLNIDQSEREKFKLEEIYYNEGKKEGLMFAKPSGSEEILYVALQYKTTRERGYPHDIGKAGAGIGEYLLAVLHDLDDPNLLKKEGEPGPFLDAWEQGWKDGVMEFYDEVKVKMFEPL